MSNWLSRKIDRDVHYILLKHTLPGVDYVVSGVKFRGGYAVVEKDSKIYYNLKKIPILSKCQEFPLLFLKKLPFITRAQDVLTIYGKDVYDRYCEVLQAAQTEEKAAKEQEVEKEHVEADGCQFKDEDGSRCNHTAFKYSPARYCSSHLLKDPALAELGFSKPGRMTREETKEYTEKAKRFLQRTVSRKEILERSSQYKWLQNLTDPQDPK